MQETRILSNILLTALAPIVWGSTYIAAQHAFVVIYRQGFACWHNIIVDLPHSTKRSVVATSHRAGAT